MHQDQYDIRRCEVYKLQILSRHTAEPGVCLLYTSGFDVAEMSISLFFSVLAGIAVWWKGKFPKPVSIAIAAAAPIAALCCMEFYTHVPWDLSIPIFLINLIFYIILYAGFTFLTGSVKSCLLYTSQCCREKFPSSCQLRDNDTG